MQKTYYIRRSRLQRLLVVQGEGAAAGYLSDQGYSIIEKNWRAGRWGEIDLITCDPSGILVFVEVKTRTVTSTVECGIYPLGFEAINLSKQRKIIRSAWRFQRERGYWSAVRFDAITVIYRPRGSCNSDTGSSSSAPDTASDPVIIHVPNAFAPL